jgi:hypothetical protein
MPLIFKGHRLLFLSTNPSPNGSVFVFYLSMGIQQSRSASGTAGKDETPPVRPKSSMSERLSASFPRLQKNRRSNSATSATKEADGPARQTGDAAAAHGENGSQNAVSSRPVHVAVYRLDQSLLTCQPLYFYLVVLLTVILVHRIAFTNASVSHSPLPGMSSLSIVALASARQGG